MGARPGTRLLAAETTVQERISNNVTCPNLESPQLIPQLYVDPSSELLPDWVREKCAASIVLVKLGSGKGSGTGVLIQPDLVLVNHHVLPDTSVAEDSEIWLSFRDPTPPGADRIRKLLPSVFYASDKGLDVALVACQSTEGTNAKHASIPLEAADLERVSKAATAGQRLLLMGHPLGHPLAVSFGKNQVLSVDEERGLVYHDCATQGGSSGSPGFNFKGDLVFMHRANVPARNANCGTSIVRISKWLREETGLADFLRLRTALTDQLVTLSTGWSFSDVGRGIADGELKELAAQTNKLWAAGTSLRVSFLGGEPSLRKRVMEVARQWESPTANIRFQEYDGPGTADIIIDFKKGDGSWSLVGTTSRGRQPSMNFGWLTVNSSPEELSRVVLHEFGHALGLQHEHQHPEAPFEFDKPKVYSYYRSRNGWSDEDIEHNVLNRQGVTAVTPFDARSIMCYDVPARLIDDPLKAVVRSSVLSDMDVKAIRALYPFPNDVAVQTEMEGAAKKKFDKLRSELEDRMREDARKLEEAENALEEMKEKVRKEAAAVAVETRRAAKEREEKEREILRLSQEAEKLKGELERRAQEGKAAKTPVTVTGRFPSTTTRPQTGKSQGLQQPSTPEGRGRAGDTSKTGKLYLSQTGSKYHTKPNGCSRKFPSIESSWEEFEKDSRSKKDKQCKKCFN